MLRSMTARQLREWLVFMEREPFGDDREDVRAGMIIQALLNIYRDRQRKGSPFRISECVVPGGDQFEEVPGQPWQHMKSIAMMFFTQYTAGKER